MKTSSIKYLFLILIGILPLLSARAQQQAMFTQYMFNQSILNPAYAASQDNVNAMLLARSQWVNFAGAPRTQTFSLHGPLTEKKFTVGLSFLNDKISVTSSTEAYADFAYQFQLVPDVYLALGLKAGFDFYQADLTKLKTISNNDPRFSEDVNNSFLPNFGFGGFLYSNDYYFGVSVPKLSRNKINMNSVVNNNTLSQEELHYYIIGGYVFELDKDIKFKPSFFAKMVKGSPLSLDVNASFLLKEKLWLGATYRFKEGFCANVELKVTNNLMLGYAFDFTTSDLLPYNYGTHEVFISLDLNFTRFRVKSPRYF